MTGMRLLLTIVGIALLAAGILFAAQGAGYFNYPADSFMLGDRTWVRNGLILALAGAAVILISRRIGRS